MAYTVLNSETEEFFTLYFTRLPLSYIETEEEIEDEPSKLGYLKIVESNGTVTENIIGVEYRGTSTQLYPKKSLKVEFWADETGEETVDVKVLSLRSDDDVNLQAMYVEPLFFLGKTNFEIWKSFHTIYYKDQEPNAYSGIDMEYTEMFINGSYCGVYAYCERMDRKQLKLKKHNGQIRGELYKGDAYGPITLFQFLPEYDNTSTLWGGYEYRHPKEEINWANLYDFADFVINSPDEEFYANYAQKMHVPTMVDYFVFMNVLRAVDNFANNTYLARYKEGEPYFYAPWDLDNSYGNGWDLSYDPNFRGVLYGNDMYVRMARDCSEGGFSDQVKARWNETKNTVFSKEAIMNMFMENYNYLKSNGVYERDYIAWSNDNALNEEFLDLMSDWIENRWLELDYQFNRDCLPLDLPEFLFSSIEVYPNPAKNFFYITGDGLKGASLAVYDFSGKKLLNKKLNGTEEKIYLPVLSNGVYAVRIETFQGVFFKKLIVRN